MARIFTIIGDLRAQAAAIEDLVPHLRASLSSGNVAKAAVAAESDGSSIGRLMSAILREPTRDSKRMRLIYKINIDGSLRERLQYLLPLKGYSLVALLLGIIGAASAWFLFNPDPLAVKRSLVVGMAGLVVSMFAGIFFRLLRAREIELNDELAAEALGLIDTATRFSRENLVV